MESHWFSSGNWQGPRYRQNSYLENNATYWKVLDVRDWHDIVACMNMMHRWNPTLEDGNAFKGMKRLKAAMETSLKYSHQILTFSVDNTYFSGSPTPWNWLIMSYWTLILVNFQCSFLGRLRPGRNSSHSALWPREASKFVWTFV